MQPLAHIGAQVGVDGPPTVIAKGCASVTVNGLAVATVGSPIVPHKRYGAKRVHNGEVIVGSPTVFAEGKAVARVGSAMGNTCSGEVISGSPNVFVP